MTAFSFLDPGLAFALPRRFDFDGYIDAERELWALFPETEGKRVNFCQLGLTAVLYSETVESAAPLGPDETYFLMPCDDLMLRPVRMQSTRRLTLDEFRMSHMTAVRMMSKLSGTEKILDEIHIRVLGAEVLAEDAERF